MCVCECVCLCARACVCMSRQIISISARRGPDKHETPLVRLSVNPSIRPSVHPFVFPFARVSDRLSIRPSCIYPFVRSSVRPSSVRPAVHLFCPSTRLFSLRPSIRPYHYQVCAPFLPSPVTQLLRINGASGNVGIPRRSRRIPRFGSHGSRTILESFSSSLLFVH